MVSGNNSLEAEDHYVRKPNQGTAMVGGNNTRGKQPSSSSRFGANIHSIHTLKHDDDEERFKSRNSFWNGNSTEYGGDNDSKWQWSKTRLSDEKLKCFTFIQYDLKLIADYNDTVYILN